MSFSAGGWLFRRVCGAIYCCGGNPLSGGANCLVGNANEVCWAEAHHYGGIVFRDASAYLVWIWSSDLVSIFSVFQVFLCNRYLHFLSDKKIGRPALSQFSSV